MAQEPGGEGGGGGGVTIFLLIITAVLLCYICVRRGIRAFHMEPGDACV